MKTILSSKQCKDEIMECDEHEIVCRLSTYLGNSPCDIRKAEEIFHEMKYEIARFVIMHEYSTRVSVSEALVMWLDEKSNPDAVDCLDQMINKYLG